MKKIQWTNDKRKLGDLVPWPRNPRQIKKDEAKRLSDSLHKFDQVETIAIGPDSEIYNGHQRLNVWIEEYGPEFEVDVRISSRALTEKEREKLTVYLHKGAAGEWDFDILANEFEVDDLIDWGFTEKELQIEGWDLGEDGDAPEPQIDKAEELQKKWQVESGQIWEIGRHRLMCGDSTSIDVQEFFNGKLADAVITDPPYGIAREGIANDDPKGLERLYSKCIGMLPITDGIIMAFLSPAMEWKWLDAIRLNGHKLERVLWMHRLAGKTWPWRGWVLAGDIIRISSVGKPKWKEPNQHNYDCYIKEELEERTLDGFHSTIKPVDVLQDLIDHAEGLIYDPFIGSGTTMVAAEQLNRICYGMEIEPKYCAVTLERMSDMGLDPKLVKDG